MHVIVKWTHLSALYLDGAADSIVAVAADGELPGPRGGDGHAAAAALAARAAGDAAAAAAAVKVAPDVDPDHVHLVLVWKEVTKLVIYSFISHFLIQSYYVAKRQVRGFVKFVPTVSKEFYLKSTTHPPFSRCL